ncbi:Alpha/Beta hydrolase protein [Pisolithus marmoratus]|nr:Alpha/Beta hydrolase protein [Pisolithus marmoratus]
MGTGVLGHSHAGLLDNQNCVLNSQRLATDRYQCCHGTGRHMGDAQLCPSRCTSDARTTVIDDLSAHVTFPTMESLSHLWNHIQSEGQFAPSSPSLPPTPVCVSLNEGEVIIPCPPLLPTHPTASLSVAHYSPLDRSSSHRSLAEPILPTPTALDALCSTHLPRSTLSIRSQSPSGLRFQTGPDSMSRESAASVLDADEHNQANFGKNFRTPKAPLVLCHGIMGFDTITIGPSIAHLHLSYWLGIKKVLEDHGCEVLITSVPATSLPVDRAKILEKEISKVYPGRAVHLIAHSMGGIDCRYLITHLTQRSFSVLSLTTISTPHHGTIFANHILSHIAGTILPGVLSFLHLFPNGGGDGRGFQSLTPEAMAEFNSNTPDVKGVRYFSWGAEYEPGDLDPWLYSHSIIYAREGPNDGLVSSQSARWGAYLGTLKGVSHVRVLGWTGWVAQGIHLPTFNFWRMRATVGGSDVGFSPGRFYLSMANLLAGVEEEEGYIRNGVWVESRARTTATAKIRDQDTPVDRGLPIRLGSAEKTNARLEEVLRRTLSPSASIDEAEGSQPPPPYRNKL